MKLKYNNYRPRMHNFIIIKIICILLFSMLLASIIIIILCVNVFFCNNIMYLYNIIMSDKYGQ